MAGWLVLVGWLVGPCWLAGWSCWVVSCYWLVGGGCLAGWSWLGLRLNHHPGSLGSTKFCPQAPRRLLQAAPRTPPCFRAPYLLGTVWAVTAKAGRPSVPAASTKSVWVSASRSEVAVHPVRSVRAGGGAAFGRAKVNTDPSKPFCEPGVRPGVQTSQAFNQARRPDQTASLPVYAWTATPHKPLWDCACDHPSGPEGWSAVCGRGSPRKVGGSGTGCSTGGTKG